MVKDIKSVITKFVDEVSQHVGPQRTEEIIKGNSAPQGIDFGSYEPESRTEDLLIYPMIEILGLSKNRFPYSNEKRNPKRPDFEVLGLDIIGENKIVNNYDEAVSDIKNYLKNKGIEESFGIATDGLKWGLHRIDTGGDFLEYDKVIEVDLRPVALRYANESGLISIDESTLDDGSEKIEELISNFNEEGLKLHLDTAPQRFRDLRQGSIDEFYDLFIELVFGEGSGESSYSTTLMADIQSPPDATKEEERVFAITLVNRLLFIKLLEEGSVLPKGFLSDRVEEYKNSESKLAKVSLYNNQIKPLFYDLFNKEKENRHPVHRRETSWFSNVPYLNGGLFRENVRNEKEYNVKDRILPILIYDLIEGHELEKGKSIDPAVLGNVFEMTINYISGEEGRQEDIGAYYTPTDASNLIVKNTVDKAIRDRIVSEYAKYPIFDTLLTGAERRKVWHIVRQEQ